MEPLSSKKWIQILSLISLVIIVVLSYGIIQYYRNRESGVNLQQTQELVAPKFEDIPPSQLNMSYSNDWEKYSSEQYGFQIAYPKNLYVLDKENLKNKNIFWINKVEGSLYPIRIIREENKEQRGIEKYFPQETIGGVEIAENYDVVINGNTFRHLLILGQGVSLLQWYIVNQRGEVFILSAEQDPLLNPKDNEQRIAILKIFSTFSFTQ